jgi:hypothetical protein
MENNQIKQPDKQEEQPPIFSSWNRLYAFVFFNLIFLIILFYLFNKIFS